MATCIDQVILAVQIIEILPIPYLSVVLGGHIEWRSLPTLTVIVVLAAILELID